jgi:hypothetical protein
MARVCGGHERSSPLGLVGAALPQVHMSPNFHTQIGV